MPIHLQRITQKESRLLHSVEQIYEESFPLDERRDFPQLKQLLNNPEMFLMAAIEDHWCVGFLIYWDLANFIFLEHTAVDHNLRGKGYGTEMLQQLSLLTEKPIVLEVELPEDEIKQKRIIFYEKHGFKLIQDYPYEQPSYDGIKPRIPMMLMSDIDNLPVKKFSYFKDKIYELVYLRFYE